MLPKISPRSKNKQVARVLPKNTIDNLVAIPEFLNNFFWAKTNYYKQFMNTRHIRFSKISQLNTIFHVTLNGAN